MPGSARMKMKIPRLALAAVAALLAAACATTKPAPPQDKEQEYRDRAFALIDGPVPELVLDLYNANIAAYPAASADVLARYTEVEKTLLQSFLEKRDVPHVKTVSANLRALSALDTATEILIEKLTLDDLVARRQTATLLARQYADPSADISVERAQIVPVTDYQRISCHILVHWTRKTANGVTRTDTPGFSGSGFFIDPTHVVTAYHVIEPVFDDSTISWSVEVKKDGEYYKAKSLLAYDSINDIAVLEMEKPFEVPANVIGMFGDARRLTPGFEIYCLGDPLGFESTWTKGIVSAVSRPAPEIGSWMQIDAAVTHGASGGLVLGSDGRIYGMIIAGLSSGDINFAVPSNTILEKLDGLLAGVNTRSPWLGLLMDSKELSKLSIADIFPSSPLKGTSLKAGDTILELNGEAVKTTAEAQRIVEGIPVGSIVRVKALQGGAPVEYYVQLMGRPEYAMYNATQGFNQRSVLYTYFGFRIDNKNVRTISWAYQGRTVQVPFYKVMEIKPRSILDLYGVRAGDEVGILSDTTVDMERTIYLLHMPQGLEKSADPSDLIIELVKGAYDENIL